MNDGLETIRSIIAKNPDLNCRIQPHKIVPEMSYRGDLGMDSLAMMAFLFELQEVYPVFNERDLARWARVSDTIESIQKK